MGATTCGATTYDSFFRLPHGEILNSTYFSIENERVRDGRGGVAHAPRVAATDTESACASGGRSVAPARGRIIQTILQTYYPGTMLAHEDSRDRPEHGTIGAEAVMTDRTRIGLLGAGAIAQLAHLPVLGKMRGVELVALCDNDGLKARALAERFGHRQRLHGH